MSKSLTVIARVRAKKGKASLLRKELRRLIAPTRAEAGCINYDLHESQDDPALFVFYENWKKRGGPRSAHADVAFPGRHETYSETGGWCGGHHQMEQGEVRISSECKN